VSPRIALGEEIKAREAGGNRIILTNVKRYGYHPLRGFNDILLLDLGLTPQGFMLTSAPRTENRVMRQVCCGR
ncbi:MAG TPA: hypothetical protein VNF70_06905, partial [Pyrinomonadaceae bacterium]|nr:hypothetical protein [Pyrinomonadaceae bacterium]